MTIAVSGLCVLRSGERLETTCHRQLVIRAWHGEGSYSRLYRGLLSGPGIATPVDCAVKVAKMEVAGAADYLRREREAWSRVRDERLPLFLDVGDTPALYLVRAWIEGTSLRHLLAQRRQLPLAGALAIFRDVAAALAALHEAGIAHGDVRGDNILVLASGSAGARLTDLGSARFEPEPHFLQAREEDIRRLGALLHEMLTGSLPAGAARLTGAAGYNPGSVALFEASQRPGATAVALASQSAAVLARLG